MGAWVKPLRARWAAGMGARVEPLGAMSNRWERGGPRVGAPGSNRWERGGLCPGMGARGACAEAADSEGRRVAVA